MIQEHSSAKQLFAGEGEMAMRMRSHNWSKTLLGEVETWPQSLRVAAQILLASRFPSQILWGTEYVLLYNDAYCPILGSKHPQSLGQRGQDCWQEVWEFANPLLEQVRTTGKAVGSDDQMLLIERSGYLEEGYFSFSYTPILDESGQVGGIFNQVYETTHQVLRERRQRLQNRLAVQVAAAKTLEAVYQLAAEALVDAVDIPLALFYQFDTLANRAHLISYVGIDRCSASQTVDLTDRESDLELTKSRTGDRSNQILKARLAEVLQTQQAVTLDDDDLRQLSVEIGVEPFRQGLIQPIAIPGQADAVGCLLVGTHPHRSLDSDYRRFFAAIAENLALVIANVNWLQQQQTARANAEALIEERKQAEATLERSKERYRTLFESIDEGFCIIELLFDDQDRPIDYRFLEINPAFENHTGMQQAQGKRMLEFAPTLERYWFEIYGKIALTGEPLRFENRAGALDRWFSIYAFRIGQPEERKIAVLFNDISDRKRIEAEREQTQRALQASEEKSRNILESITDAFFALDLEWRFTYVNRQAERLLDRTSGELLGKILWEEYPGLAGSEFEQVYQQASSKRVAASVVAFYPDHDRWYEVHIYPSADGTTLYFRNVTEAKRIEAEREQILQREQKARAAAETVNRIKDEFLAVLSHELRSPLNPILGWSKLLQQGKLDAVKTTIALATIERNARLQAQLIDDLLDISRILRGKLSMNVMPVDLSTVVSAAMETVRLAAEAKSLEIQTVISAGVGMVTGDAGRLQQVVWNLLSNAVKFTPQGGQITVALTQVETDAQLQVIDTGKGIHPDFLPYVFEHFRQEDGATTRKFGGLGLGLAIARQIVELHGGIVKAESPGEGQGATFTIQIPTREPQASNLNNQPYPHPSSLSKFHNSLTGLRILVVDDEADSRNLVEFILEQSGGMITSVASGSEALSAIARSVPDLIVSDIGMPEMDGYVLIQLIRALKTDRQVPAIALTAYAGETVQRQIIAAGFQAHLTKPIEPETLINRICHLFNQRQAEEPR